MTIADRIKRLRKYNNLTQTQFGEKVNARLSTVQAWEKGTNEPKASNIQLIAKTFNVSAEWLLHGTGQMLSYQSDSDVDKMINWITSLKGDDLIWFKKQFKRTFPDYEE